MHQVIGVSSEGPAILLVLWHFPSMAVNATPQGPVSPVNSTLLSFTWPLSKPQLQRVESTGMSMESVFSPSNALPFWSFYMGGCGILI